MKTTTVKVPLNPVELHMLHRLAETGVWGPTVEDVINRIVDDRLRKIFLDRDVLRRGMRYTPR